MKWRSLSVIISLLDTDSKAVLTDLNFEVNEQDYLCIVRKKTVPARAHL